MNPPPEIQPPRRNHAWLLTVVLPLAAAVIVLFLFNPSRYGFYPRCVLYVITGIYCPGCGSLRALHQLSHGHLLTALRCNVLLIASLPFFAIFALNWLRCWIAGAPLPSCTPNPNWIRAIIAVLVVFTILRNIHIEPFIWLAPP